MRGLLDTPEGEEGLINLLRTASILGNGQMQFSYVDNATLIAAQKDPAKYHDSYIPAARLNKSKVSCDKEDGFYRNWIGGVLGGKPLVEIAPFDLERLKKVMKPLPDEEKIRELITR